MAMSEYYATYLITQDPDLRVRVTACADQQAELADKKIGPPETWAEMYRWDWAAAPGWSAKAMSAIEKGITFWGKDPTVITDGDILSVIQPMILAMPEIPEEALQAMNQRLPMPRRRTTNEGA